MLCDLIPRSVIHEVFTREKTPVSVQFQFYRPANSKVHSDVMAREIIQMPRASTLFHGDGSNIYISDRLGCIGKIGIEEMSPAA